VAFGAAFETLYQESQKLDSLFFVLIDDDGLYLLLFRGRKRNLFVCHSFSPYLDLVERRQAAPERVAHRPAVKSHDLPRTFGFSVGCLCAVNRVWAPAKSSRRPTASTLTRRAFGRLGTAGVAFAGLQNPHQVTQIPQGLSPVFVDNNGLNFLLLRYRKAHNHICHIDLPIHFP
jgi:hypothetical protein